MQPAKLSCRGCGKLSVCFIFRTLAQGHKQIFPEGSKPAFQIEEIANICEEFISQTVMELSNSELPQKYEAEKSIEAE